MFSFIEKEVSYGILKRDMWQMTKIPQNVE